MAESRAIETADVSPQKMRQVIAASAAGTVFGLPDAQAFIFTLLTFAVGFIVRPLGALIFGKMGDTKGRKGTFLITITMMGLATVAIGLLPDYAWFETHVGPGAGVIAPILLVLCRILQGFALGGEYGGAVIYVAEHAPARQARLPHELDPNVGRPRPARRARRDADYAHHHR